MNQIVDSSFEQELIIKEVIAVRKSHPRMGTRKLYDKLSEFLLKPIKYATD